MSRFAWIVPVLAIFLTAQAVAQAPDLSSLDIVERSIPPGPVALVEGSPVDSADFLYLYRSQLAAFALQQRSPEVKDSDRVKIGLRALAELIQREILWQEGVRRGFNVPPAELEAAYDRKLKALQQQLSRQDGGALSEAEILEQSGQTREEALDEMKKSILVQKTWDTLAAEKGAKVTENEIMQFYQDNPEIFRRPASLHLMQIFILPKPNPREANEAAWQEAEKKAENALARIRAGESFQAVARDVSNAPDAKNGGDMGLAPVEMLPPFFVERARTLAPGAMSNVFRSEHGVHLIRLIEAEDSENVSLDEVRDRIEVVLKEQKTESIVSDFCAPILKDPKRVHIFLQLERTLAALPGGGQNLFPDPPK
jgi:hypothetical protein